MTTRRVAFLLTPIVTCAKVLSWDMPADYNYQTHRSLGVKEGQGEGLK